MSGYKRAFSMSIGRPGAPLHFAAHSHHPWPDVTFAAHERAWRDAAERLDTKWGKVFGEVIPKAQAHIARILNLPDPQTIAFAPNTHEFLVRLLSCVEPGGCPHILSTDSEFHTFARQLARLEEDDLAELTKVAAEPLATFPARFAKACSAGRYDMIFVSNVLFNSAYWLRDLEAIVRSVDNPQTLIVIDGYHSFMAVPLDLASLSSRIFFMSGGYKYAMAGEGVAFLHAPPGYGPRPANTGWYAEFAELAKARPGTIGYADTGMRFMGATFDPSGLYRFNAAMDWLDSEGITVQNILDHTRKLQRHCVDFLTEGPHRLKPEQLILQPGDPALARFLTFETPVAQTIQKDLAAAGIMTDARGTRLRIGFGLYQDTDDVARLCQALRE